MFADALDKARQFTRPIFAAVRFYDGSTQGGVAACVVINRDGWFVTAAHMLDPFMALGQHGKEIADYDAAVAAIRADPKMRNAERHKRLRQLRPNAKWITNQSLSGQGCELVDWAASRDIDLAVGRLQPFDATTIAQYPTFKNPAKLRVGTSLCRLGYPFLDVACTFDATNNSFALQHSDLMFFPNEGIFTRELKGQLSPNGPFTVRYVETSSPGLRGQSGGPVVDSSGLVWGIQVHTQPLALEFNPKHKLPDGKEVEVHHFLNVGRAVHPLTIQEFLNHQHVQFEQEQ